MAKRSRAYLKYLVALSAAGFAPVITAAPALAATTPDTSVIRTPQDMKVSAAAIGTLADSAGITAMCWGEWGQWGQWGQWDQWSECGPIVTISPPGVTGESVTQLPSLHAILRES